MKSFLSSVFYLVAAGLSLVAFYYFPFWLEDLTGPLGFRVGLALWAALLVVIAGQLERR